MRALAAILLTCALLPAPAAAQTPDPSSLVKAELLAEPAAVVPGRPFLVGVRLTMAEHWHTYWRNPGDSGLATEIRWTLPEGFSAGPIQWPVPQAIPVGPLVNYGYEGTATLLVEITPPASLPAGGAVPLAAEVSYLVCQRECIPGEAGVALTLPAAAPGAPAAPSAAAPAFEAARAALPQPAPFGTRFRLGADTVALQIDAGGPASAIRTLRFFPESESLIEHAAPQAFALAEGRPVLTMRRSQLLQAGPAEVRGILVVEEAAGEGLARHAFAVAAGPEAAAAAPPAAAALSATLLQAMALALLGGLILNLMPCVFPVLSIKILHLSQHGGSAPGRMRAHGLAYTAGVLACFAALAGLLYAVRAAGAEVGWGFQLQSPVVVAGLAFLLLAMALSLSGVVDFGLSLTGVGSGLAARPGLRGSFFAGVLATVVATPCTAPFMGTAVGFALTQPPAVGLAVFLALGFGLALPFLVLTVAPPLLRWLPRPGAWMETLKQVLAFPLYATVAWLVWVLSQQVGPAGLAAALAGLVLVAFAAFLLGKAGHAAGWRAHAVRGLAAASALALVPAVQAIAVDATAAPGAAAQAAPSSDGTERFTQARLDALVGERRQPVFVNLTAAWCITCLVNERTALSTEAVRRLFRDKNIVYLKGDWTNRNPEITRVLERHGRSGVPLYLLFARGGEPRVLPQILTERMLIEELSSL